MRNNSRLNRNRQPPLISQKYGKRIVNVAHDPPVRRKVPHHPYRRPKERERLVNRVRPQAKSHALAGGVLRLRPGGHPGRRAEVVVDLGVADGAESVLGDEVL